LTPNCSHAARNTSTRIFALAAKIIHAIVCAMKHMTLQQWCERDGRHLSAIATEFEISLSQLYRLLDGGGTRKGTALRIQAATGGKVRAATLLGVDA
jgi:hypothetical protein